MFEYANYLFSLRKNKYNKKYVNIKISLFTNFLRWLVKIEIAFLEN